VLKKIDENLNNLDRKRLNVIPIIDQLIDSKFEKEFILIFRKVD